MSKTERIWALICAVWLIIGVGMTTAATDTPDPGGTFIGVFLLPVVVVAAVLWIRRAK